MTQSLLTKISLFPSAPRPAGSLNGGAQWAASGCGAVSLPPTSARRTKRGRAPACGARARPVPGRPPPGAPCPSSRWRGRGAAAMYQRVAPSVRTRASFARSRSRTDCARQISTRSSAAVRARAIKQTFYLRIFCATLCSDLMTHRREKKKW